MDKDQFKDVFEQDNFDPIKYINEKFPDENSLQNLDSEIEMLQQELEVMNEDLTSSIHDHALNNAQMQEEIQNAHQTTVSIIQEINQIKTKAEKSENLVYEMCKDIKSLDTAKKNLTFSITALKKFIMMMTAIDKLRESCEQKIYRDVANLLSAFEELSQYFKRYQNIPQILDLFKEKDAIVKLLREQLKEDFEAYDRQATVLTSQDMGYACQTVESLGLNFRNEIVGQICGLVLDNYRKTFESSEYNNLENYERRFQWLQRNIKEFENRWTGVFPEYWALNNFIIYEFCGLTRLNLTEILSREGSQTDVKNLMTALQLTLSFEQSISKDMEKRYNHYLELNQLQTLNEQEKQEKLQQFDPELVKIREEKSNFMIQRLPKFKGSISDSFEPYLAPYIQQEEKDLKDYIKKQIQEQANQRDDEEKVSDLNVLNSSLYMFNYIKTLIKRGSQYSRSELMVKVGGVIKTGLAMYSQELVIMLQKEEKHKNNNIQKFMGQIGYVINTAEYCKENMQGLQDAIDQCLDEAYQEQIDLMNEEELFIQTINKGIDILLNHIGKVIDPKFNDILKGLNYGNIEAMDVNPEHNTHVLVIKQELNNHVQMLKNMISEVYFISYLNKLVVMISNKLTQTIYKFQKFESGAFPQMMSDCTELEVCLKEMAKLGNERKTSSYDNFVSKIFDKTKKLLKLLNMPGDSIVDNFPKFIDEASVQDIEKIIKIKGLKKQEVQGLFNYAKK